MGARTSNVISSSTSMSRNATKSRAPSVLSTGAVQGTQLCLICDAGAASTACAGGPRDAARPIWTVASALALLLSAATPRTTTEPRVIRRLVKTPCLPALRLTLSNSLAGSPSRTARLFAWVAAAPRCTRSSGSSTPAGVVIENVLNCMSISRRNRATWDTIIMKKYEPADEAEGRHITIGLG